MKEVLKQMVGYLAGGFLVLLIIPYGIYSAAEKFDPILGFKLLQAEKLKITLAIFLFLTGLVFGIWQSINAYPLDSQKIKGSLDSDRSK